MLMRDERKKVHNYQLSVGFFDWVVAAAHSRETWKVLDCREPLSPPPTPPNQILEPGWGASIAAPWAVNDTGQPVQSPRGGHLRAFSCGELLELRDYQDTKRRRRLSFSRLSRTYFCLLHARGYTKATSETSPTCTGEWPLTSDLGPSMRRTCSSANTGRRLQTRPTVCLHVHMCLLLKGTRSGLPAQQVQAQNPKQSWYLIQHTITITVRHHLDCLPNSSARACGFTSGQMWLCYMCSCSGLQNML